jgi:hypothetical protein
MKEPVSIFIRRSIEKYSKKKFSIFKKLHTNFNKKFVNVKYLEWSIPNNDIRFEIYKALFDYGSGIQDVQKFCSKNSKIEKVNKKFFKTIHFKKLTALKISKETKDYWLEKKQKYLGDGVVIAFYQYFKKFSKNQQKLFDQLIQKVNKFFIHDVLLGKRYARSFCRCRKMTSFFKDQGEKKSGVSAKTVRQFRKALHVAHKKC